MTRDVLLACLAFLTLTACDSSETVRYRLTVEVDTPQGEREGSSVIEVEVREQPPGPTLGNKVRLRHHGEAVAVDMPNGKTLFALLYNERDLVEAGNLYPWRALLPAPGGDHAWGVRAARNLEKREGPYPLPPAFYPTFVTFDDPTNHATIILLDKDDIAAEFGSGTRISNVTVEMTDDRVTRGLPDRLPWLTDPTLESSPNDVYPEGLPLGNFRGLFHRK
ncbi:hypothetical protein [Qipengyuania sp. JC766]|uniref:hypothetical protein n=1 Tax=Qipengyuania sp. JC766 TaxID=3232139 RepID=UPI003457C4FA